MGDTVSLGCRPGGAGQAASLHLDHWLHLPRGREHPAFLFVGREGFSTWFLRLWLVPAQQAGTLHQVSVQGSPKWVCGLLPGGPSPQVQGLV